LFLASNGRHGRHLKNMTSYKNVNRCVLLEEKSCQSSSLSDLKRPDGASLGLFEKHRPNTKKKKKNKMRAIWDQFLIQKYPQNIKKTCTVTKQSKKNCSTSQISTGFYASVLSSKMYMWL